MDIKNHVAWEKHIQKQTATMEDLGYDVQLTYVKRNYRRARLALEDKQMPERFYFERPSAARKVDIIEYLNEFVMAGSEINGTGSLDRILSGCSFEEALDRCLNMENKEYADKAGRCPGKTFLMIRENDHRLVGTVNVRWDLNEEMLRFGGHIGYGIRPYERRKGYGKINLYLALKEADHVGLDRVMIGCSVSNVASNKTIQALGGVLERCEIDPSDGEMSNVYWINIEESLRRYEAEYKPYIVGQCEGLTYVKRETAE